MGQVEAAKKAAEAYKASRPEATALDLAQIEIGYLRGCVAEFEEELRPAVDRNAYFEVEVDNGHAYFTDEGEFVCYTDGNAVIDADNVSESLIKTFVEMYEEEVANDASIIETQNADRYP